MKRQYITLLIIIAVVTLIFIHIISMLLFDVKSTDALSFDVNASYGLMKDKEQNKDILVYYKNNRILEYTELNNNFKNVYMTKGGLILNGQTSVCYSNKDGKLVENSCPYNYESISATTNEYVNNHNEFTLIKSITTDHLSNATKTALGIDLKQDEDVNLYAEFNSKFKDLNVEKKEYQLVDFDTYRLH